MIKLTALLLLGGCAATIPMELANARLAYRDAVNGPAATLVPADVHIAETALAAAEASFKSDPRGYATVDLAYVARRKAELAEARASAALEAQSTALSNGRYEVAQQEIMDDTKARLGDARSDLAASEAAGARTADQLATSEAARASAERRASDAMIALSRLAAVHEEARGLVITLSGSVVFRTNESTILPEARAKLAEVAAALIAAKERMVLVEGHTDSQGSDADNLSLSERRAGTVRLFLIEQGMDPSHVRAVGIGEARPVADNLTPEGRANNRRVEIVLEPELIAKQ